MSDNQVTVSETPQLPVEMFDQAVSGGAATQELPPVEAPVIQPNFQSAMDEANNMFYIGMVLPENVKPDGTYSLGNSLRYDNVDLAITQLDAMLKQAYQFRSIMFYKKGLVDGEQQALAPVSDQTELDLAPTTAIETETHSATTETVASQESQ